MKLSSSSRAVRKLRINPNPKVSSFRDRSSSVFLLPAELLSALHLAHHALLGFDAAAGAHGFEHLSHLAVLAEEVVDVLHGGAGAGGDALAAAAVDELVVLALLVRHRVDDGLDAGELAFVHVFDRLLHAREGADRGEHLEDGLHAAHLFNLT